MKRSGGKKPITKEIPFSFMVNLVESCCVSVNALEDIETSDKDEKVEETEFNKVESWCIIYIELEILTERS